MNQTADNWSGYWQDEGQGGEVFVDAQGNAHPALAAHWAGILDGVPAGARLIDLACGGGSIFAHIENRSECILYGADISAEAVALLENRFPGVHGIVCEAEAVPCDDGSFDYVLSQFGVEYAGLPAFEEAARLIAPGGRFAALCHIRDGQIDARNAVNLTHAELVVETGFIDHALALTKTLFGGDEAAIARTSAAFEPAAKAVSAAVAQNPQSVHTHLYQGFRQLYERRTAYIESDITGWLEGMRGEVDKTVTRLTHMRSAALSPDQIDRIKHIFAAAGCAETTIDQFTLPGEDLPLAWSVTAHKSA